MLLPPLLGNIVSFIILRPARRGFSKSLSLRNLARDLQPRVVLFVFLLKQISARSLARSLRSTFPAADAYAYFYLDGAVRSVSSLLVYLNEYEANTRNEQKIFLKLLSLPINLLSAMTLSLALHRAKTRSWTWMVTKRGKSPLLGSAVVSSAVQLLMLTSLSRFE